MPTEPHYRAADLATFATRLFAVAGCDAGKASAIAEHLVEADLMGHTTHGLAQAGAYLEELESGAMVKTGEPTVLADRPAAVTWDGGFLPGVWLVRNALDLAIERARKFGIAAVAIRRSHHIACLSVYLRQATERQMMCIVACSDPSDATMAPFGGTTPVFTPDPIAIGIPTKGDPIMVDISSSITTNAMTGRLKREGKRYPGKWALDKSGQPTDDPAAISAGGTLLPTGGHDHGHKGYGLALTVEAMTQGLSGYGRAEKPTIWGANVYVQVDGPGRFRRHRKLSARNQLGGGSLPAEPAAGGEGQGAAAGRTGFAAPAPRVGRRPRPLSWHHGRAGELGKKDEGRSSQADLEPPARRHDAGHAVCLLAVVDSEERAVFRHHRAGIAEIAIGQAAANADGALDIPALAAIAGDDRTDAEIRPPPAIGAEDAPVAQRQEMRGITLDRQRSRRRPAPAFILGEDRMQMPCTIVAHQHQEPAVR